MVASTDDNQASAAPAMSSTSSPLALPTYQQLKLTPLFSQHDGGSVSTNKQSQRQQHGLVKLELNNPPVNALSTTLLQELIDVFQHISDSNTITGVLLSSHLTTVFSGGLDVKQAVTQLGSPARAAEYRILITTATTAPRRCLKPVVCVLAGTAVGGAMVLAGSCDYLVLDKRTAQKAQIGLTENAVGVPWTNSAMPSLRLMFNNNTRAMRKFVYDAELMPLAEAHTVWKFGDACVDNPKHHAIEWLVHRMRIPTALFSAAKQQINKANSPDEELAASNDHIRSQLGQLFYDNRQMMHDKLRQIEQAKQRKQSKL